MAIASGCVSSPPTVVRTAEAKLLLLDAAITTNRLGDLVLAEKTPRRDSILLTFTNATWVVKIEAMSRLEPDSAEALTQEGIMGIHALFADALSPYPGDISNRVVSRAQFAPRFREEAVRGRLRRWFLLYANARFGYGATTADSIKYRSLLGWIYSASSQTLYKLRCFAPPQTPPEELERWLLALD